MANMFQKQNTNVLSSAQLYVSTVCQAELQALVWEVVQSFWFFTNGFSVPLVQLALDKTWELLCNLSPKNSALVNNFEFLRRQTSKQNSGQYFFF